ncbi:hypothetical protein ADEAN_000715300 [Angomonas deanei]|uniref:Uncharacterized protein n=1 Tax=Angomonas deanei TaxID=59799 RepID=A0A7G2CL50_9TRYP|nr:hypothetical protein ADEAN_000715300 [Angomonas deanei]
MDFQEAFQSDSSASPFDPSTPKRTLLEIFSNSPPKKESQSDETTPMRGPPAVPKPAEQVLRQFSVQAYTHKVKAKPQYEGECNLSVVLAAGPYGSSTVVPYLTIARKAQGTILVEKCLSDTALFSSLSRGENSTGQQLYMQLEEEQANPWVLEVMCQTSDQVDLLLVTLFGLSYSLCATPFDENIFALSLPSNHTRTSGYSSTTVWETAEVEGDPRLVAVSGKAQSPPKAVSEMTKRCLPTIRAAITGPTKGDTLFIRFEENTSKRVFIVVVSSDGASDMSPLKEESAVPVVFSAPPRSQHQALDLSSASNQLSTVQWQVAALYDLFILRREPSATLTKREADTSDANSKQEELSIRLKEMEESYNRSLKLLNEYEEKNTALSRELASQQELCERRVTAAVEQVRSELSLHFGRELLRLQNVEAEYHRECSERDRRRAILDSTVRVDPAQLADAESRIVQLEQQLGEERTKHLSTRRKLEDEISTLNSALSEKRVVSLDEGYSNERAAKLAVRRALNALYNTVESKLEAADDSTKLMLLTVLYESMKENAS